MSGDRKNSAEKVLAFARGNSIFLTPHGLLAQLVERLNGIEEVSGSNPLGSTNFPAARLGFLVFGEEKTLEESEIDRGARPASRGGARDYWRTTNRRGADQA